MDKTYDLCQKCNNPIPYLRDGVLIDPCFYCEWAIKGAEKRVKDVDCDQ